MNKNSLLAFVLIAIAVFFFSGETWNRFWYETVLKRPMPATFQNRSRQQRPAESGADEREAVDKAEDAKFYASVITPVGEAETATAHDGPADESADGDGDMIMHVACDTIFVETDRLIAGVSTTGARIVSLRMKEYTYSTGSRKGELIDLIPMGSNGGAQLAINTESFDYKHFTVENLSDNHIVIPPNEDFRLILETQFAGGRPLQKIFTFTNDTYKIGYSVSANNLTGRNVTIGWSGGIEESESSDGMPFGQMMDKRRAHYSDGQRVHHVEMKKRGSEEPSGVFRWVGKSSKYFFVALVAPEATDADIKILGRDATARQPGGIMPRDATIDYSIYYQTMAASNEIDNWIYAGPGGLKELSLHDLKFEKSLFPVLNWARHIFWAGSWFPPLAEFILWMLLFFYGLVKDYGVAIFLLTLLTKVITYPMTHSSMKTMMRMKDVQPKLLALREKYKHNPQKLNEEMMALYKAEGINPLNPGCLPMFLQMPIFIALFIVLRRSIELRGASSFLLPWVNDLSLPEALFYLPGNGLPIYGNNVALMPIIMAVLTYFQQRQTITDPNQKALLYMMPPLMLVMFNSFPAGVVFYWTVSSALGLLQNMLLKPKPKAAVGADIGMGITGKTETNKGTNKVTKAVDVDAVKKKKKKKKKSESSSLLVGQGNRQQRRQR